MGAAGSITSFEIGDEVLLADGIESENGLLAGEYATITEVPKIGMTSYKLKRISDEKLNRGTSKVYFKVDFDDFWVHVSYV